MYRVLHVRIHPCTEYSVPAPSVPTAHVKSTLLSVPFSCMPQSHSGSCTALGISFCPGSAFTKRSGIAAVLCTPSSQRTGDFYEERGRCDGMCDLAACLRTVLRTVVSTELGTALATVSLELQPVSAMQAPSF